MPAQHGLGPTQDPEGSRQPTPGASAAALAAGTAQGPGLQQPQPGQGAAFTVSVRDLT